MTLAQKVNKSKKIIKNTLNSYPKEKIAVAWTGGKDSTLVLHLIREIYTGKVPIKVFFNDSGYEFLEVLDFIKKIELEWDLDLIKFEHSESFMRKINKKPSSLLFRQAKIDSIKRAAEEHDIKVFIAGIRRDEHPARSREKYISKRRDQVRVHPILDFTESDVWEYIRKYKVPHVSLYGRGYRSLGEAPFTRPVKKGKKERSGRDTEKEKTMERLRSLGYW